MNTNEAHNRCAEFLRRECVVHNITLCGQALAVLSAAFAMNANAQTAPPSTRGPLLQTVTMVASTGYQSKVQKRISLYVVVEGPRFQNENQQYVFCSYSISDLSSNLDAGHRLVESTPTLLRWQYWAKSWSNDGERAWFYAVYRVRFIHPSATTEERKLEGCNPQPRAQPEKRWPDEEAPVGGPGSGHANEYRALVILKINCIDRATGRDVSFVELKAWAPSCRQARQGALNVDAGRDICTQPNEGGRRDVEQIESGTKEWIPTDTCP